MKAEFEIEDKLNHLYRCIELEGGIFDLCWCQELLYPYYKHFNDENPRYRIGSLVAFQGLLQEWEDGSGFPFYTGVEKYPCHDFEKYIQTFLENSLSVKEHYPATYAMIVETLRAIDSRNTLEDVFPNMDRKIIENAKEVLLNEESSITDNTYQEMFNEAGIVF